MTRWAHLGDLFEKVKNRFQGGLNQDRVVSIFKELAPRAEPLFFNKKTGELLAKVPNSALAQNLHFRSYQIIEEINKRIGRKILRRIRFRVGAMAD